MTTYMTPPTTYRIKSLLLACSIVAMAGLSACGMTSLSD